MDSEVYDLYKKEILISYSLDFNYCKMIIKRVLPHG